MPVSPIRFRGRDEWKAWLEEHHATESEATLILSKKAVSGGLHYADALDEALCFGWIDGRLHARNAASFLLRFSPRRSGSVWSESNRERVERLIREGRMTSAGLERVEEARRSGRWQSANCVSRVPPMPRDLRDALRARPSAWSHFRAWAATHRSACIRYVTDVKRESTRKERIGRVVKRAAADQRPGIEGF